MRAFRILALALAAYAVSLVSAPAQIAQNVAPGYLTTSGCPSGARTPCFVPYNATTPMPVSGSFSATLSGFAPGVAYSTLSVSNVTSNVALPAGTVVVVYNTGSNAAYVKLGTTNAVTVATSAADVIQPGSWMAFTVGSNAYIAGITANSTTSLLISGGSGLPTGSGGGSSSGGSTAIAPVVSTSAESSHVLKASAGSMVGLSATTGASAGYVMVFDATSAPVDGAVTPKYCWSVGANGSLGIGFGVNPASFSTGITVVFSTTGCFTKTASATAFFSGQVQ